MQACWPGTAIANHASCSPTKAKPWSHATLLPCTKHAPVAACRASGAGAAAGTRGAGAGGVGGASRSREASCSNTGSRTWSATGLLRILATCGNGWDGSKARVMSWAGGVMQRLLAGRLAAAGQFGGAALYSFADQAGQDSTPALLLAVHSYRTPRAVASNLAGGCRLLGTGLRQRRRQYTQPPCAAITPLPQASRRGTQRASSRARPV